MTDDRVQRPLVRFDLHQAEETKPGSGFFGRVGEFLDTKLGTALLTFIFTVVLSALITDWIAWIDKERDERIEKRADQAKHLGEVRALLADGMIDRATHADMIASALANGFPREDVERRWQHYEQAYQNYNKMSFLVRTEANDLKPDRNKGGNPFLATLDGPVEKSFTRLDRCIVAAYGGHPNKVTPDGYSPTLSCASSSGSKDWNVGNESQILRGCLATYLIQMDDMIWLKNKAQDPDARPGFLTRAQEERQKTPNSCAPHDFRCWEAAAWSKLPKRLERACAVLGGKY